MAEIRKISPGRGISSVVALHGFVTNDDGDLIYTKSTDTKTLINPNEYINQILNIEVGRNSGDTANVYYVNDVENPVINFQRGVTYIFDQSSSTNDAHPLLFSATLDGKLSGGTTYEVNVVYVLDGVSVNEASYISGFSSANDRKIWIEVDANSPDILYYWCNYHTGMGNSIDISNDPLDSAYKVYEIGTSGYNYKINTDGELVIEYESDE